MILLIVPVLLAIVYGCIQLVYARAWQTLPEWRIPEGFEPEIPVTVVVAARNEANCITDCLQSIINGSYPQTLLEIIVVDDFSTDHTVAVVQQWIQDHTNRANMQLLQLGKLLPPEHQHRNNKKKAIECAVARARGAIMVTTDADCVAPQDWLRFLVSRFSQEPKLLLLTAPVVFYRESNFLQRFQSLDFLGLMGITGAGIHLGWQHMGNGANLAYRKAAFEAVSGYSGNENISSGDDMFLIQKMAAKWPGSIGFLKNASASVLTEAPATWRAFWYQRLRWGSKNAALPEWPIRIVLLVVWLFCWSIVASVALVLAGRLSIQVLLFQLLVKLGVDWQLLWRVCRYFGRKDLLRWVFPAFFWHIGYIVVLGTGSLLTFRFRWKW